ncbi:HEPN domain-containing protein [Massilia sp. 9I]|uniref:HEPN domain-containing protein n=1 Tax=Massilia sp. 9I TaxID=2653152 RepID=UPI0012F0928B|nr:HEPN domain-containing protein [Massilia sp. 9I]VXC13599.1 conserved hypothetical protein [Massilia sp. 9I]
MKSEYLITFDSKDGICTSVDKFKNLLASHTSISLNKKEKIGFNGRDFPYQLAQGTLTDGSLYYDLTIEDTEPSEREIYTSLLKEVRRICAKISGRNIIVLHDGVGEDYCQAGYPIIYKTENLMRKLIAKFMAISIGYDWSDASTPKEVLESVRSDGRKEKTNFLQEVDFIQLSNFLFKKYTKSDAARFIDSLKEKGDDEIIKVGDLKHYSPFTNWEKYFAKKVNCDSEYLRTRWERLYEYRCKIAHCKGLSKQEFEDLTQISSDICEKIQAALDSIGDVHVEGDEREELAENFSGAASKSAADFIAKYNRLAELIQFVCLAASNESDMYTKHEANKTNIRMQSRYLCSVKGLIDKDMVALINHAQTFRNKVVHQVGISDISESELVEQASAIDLALETIGSLNFPHVEKMKGVDLRSSSSQQEVM